MLLGSLALFVAGCSPALPRGEAGAPGPSDAGSAVRSAAVELADARSLGTPVVGRSRRSWEPGPQAQAEGDAARVFRSMHAEVLACYAKRLATHPRAHAAVTVDVLVGQDGRPRDVATTGGALLGPAVLSCVKRCVMRASFAPSGEGGTSRVRVPFAFHPDVVGDDG
ncbi:MAG: AgmX/PglI C-terminal domain-containing protein [Labilithrix sp.]|nr:AgmX/PglI C-terminal domain-containing protein [Labilithrix sp.]